MQELIVVRPNPGELFFFSAEHFSALPNISRLCWVFFFCFAKYLCSMLSVFSSLPDIFLPCWGLFCSAKHCSSVLSTFCFYQTFFFYAELFSTPPAFFGYAEPFSALASILLRCRAAHAEQKNARQRRKTLSMEEKCLEEPKSVQRSRKIAWRSSKKRSASRRKMLGNAVKCSAKKNNRSAVQQMCI